MSWRIIPGDCIEAMRGLDEASIDAIVTDPPYGLGFMGREWDSLPPGDEFAAEALRVLRPGGHLLAFGGTRTYHRLACAIEDAGFEVRDSLGWQHMEPVFCRCGSLPSSHEDLSREGVRDLRPGVAADDPVSGGAEQDLRPEVRGGSGQPGEAREGASRAAEADDADLPGLRSGVRDSHLPVEAGRESDLLAEVQRDATRSGVGEARPQRSGGLDGREPGELRGEDEWRDEPRVEGRGDVLAEEGELPADQVRPSAGVGDADGPEGRLHHGAPASDGDEDRAAADADGGRASHRPRSAEQRPGEPGTLAVEWIAQGGGAWPGCPRCGKPLEPPFFAGPLAWDYGSGFPKSLDVSKAIDKAAGAEREVVGRHIQSKQERKLGSSLKGSEDGSLAWQHDLTAPATPEAAQWQGWGTALKPAHEPIVLARKPLTGTVAGNVLAHGTGALNVDGCRIEHQSEADRASATPGGRVTSNAAAGAAPDVDGGERREIERPDTSLGRWPANVILDPEAARLLDEQSGERQAGARPKDNNVGFGGVYTEGGERAGVHRTERIELDSGGASRFFYTAKASRAERNAGLEGFEERDAANPYAAGQGMGGRSLVEGEWVNTDAPRKARANVHPTVKPIALMRWLCRLVTPPGGTILDPFTGSGTTGAAAVLEGFGFIGCEREDEYVRIAEARIAFWAQYPGADAEAVLRSDDQQRRDEGQLDLLGAA